MPIPTLIPHQLPLGKKDDQKEMIASMIYGRDPLRFEENALYLVKKLSTRFGIYFHSRAEFQRFRAGVLAILRNIDEKEKTALARYFWNMAGDRDINLRARLIEKARQKGFIFQSPEREYPPFKEDIRRRIVRLQLEYERLEREATGKSFDPPEGRKKRCYEKKPEQFSLPL